jgi:hypothetical protein
VLTVFRILGRPPVLRRLAVTLPVALLTVTAVTGCTGDDDPEPSDPASVDPTRAEGPAAPTLQREPAPQRITVRRVWGEWPARGQARRSAQLSRQAGRAVTAWMDHAYVGVDFPTKGPASFAGAFATFTSGAGRDARRDRLTFDVDLGARLVDAVPTRRTVQLVAYAPRGRAVGATAVVQLVLLGLRGDGEKVETALTGELYLTRVGTQWQVFGYDVDRSTGAPGSYARASRPGKRAGGQGQPGAGGGQ